MALKIKLQEYLIHSAARCFIPKDKIIPKYIWKGKGARIAQSVLKKDKVEWITLPNVKT